MVERATGYLMLLHLPHGRAVEHVTTALTQRPMELPDSLRQFPTKDHDKELSQHAKVGIETDIGIYFADRRTPWHRPLDREHQRAVAPAPKGTDMSVHGSEHLRFVEQEMNDRPRKRLDFLEPQELMTQLLLGV